MTPAVLSAADIYKLIRQAGCPAVVAVSLVAVALRESSGNPAAFNGDVKTGDKSYGLWQINMLDKLDEPRRMLFGIQKDEELFTPEVNARAALKLWAGDNRNLSRCWYIDKAGPYQARYESHLAAAQAAALAQGA